MRRVLVVTWALGTASGVLLGLFGVQLVSSRFSTNRVSPLSHPEVLRALQAARSVPPASRDEAALSVVPAPDTANPPASPPTDAAPAKPSAGATSTPAQASPASTLPRPGTAGTLVDTAGVASAPSTTSTVTAPPEPTSTTTATSATTTTTPKPKSDSKKSTKSSTTTTTERKPTTTTTQPPRPSGSQGSTFTKAISSKGGVVTVRWSDGKVSGVARPESGWEVKVAQNGPDKVEVWFWKEGRLSQVEAWSNGAWKVTEWRCYSRSRFDCETV